MRLVVFHRGGQSGCFQSLVDQWRVHHPDIEVRTHDLYTELFGGLGKLRALPKAVRRGGLAVLRPGSGAFTDALNRTVWLGRQLSACARRIQEQESADASFQFGTTYDAACAGRPHFIYADLTILANLYYPNSQLAFQRWSAWLPDEREALRRAERVFTHSELVSRSVVEQYALPADKALCVCAGANAPPVSEQDVDPGRFERQNVLFIGLEWERKGGPQLVQAFREVRRRLPGATLTIVGCRPAVDEPGVDIVGRVPMPEVPRYLGRASVFCMPSLREQFGYVYLEAMQSGLPVVASRRGPAPEFVRDDETGFAIEPDNPAELAERLYQLLADPELCRRLGAGGRSLVQTTYNWTKTCAQMTDAIRGVVAACA